MELLESSPREEQGALCGNIRLRTISIAFSPQRIVVRKNHQKQILLLRQNNFESLQYIVLEQDCLLSHEIRVRGVAEYENPARSTPFMQWWRRYCNGAEIERRCDEYWENKGKAVQLDFVHDAMMREFMRATEDSSLPARWYANQVQRTAMHYLDIRNHLSQEAANAQVIMHARYGIDVMHLEPAHEYAEGKLELVK